MKKAVVIYNLFLAAIITLAGLVTAKSGTDILISLAFLPVGIYFAIQLFKKAPPKANTQKLYSISPVTINGRHLEMAGSRPRATDPVENVVEPEVLTGKHEAQAMHRMGIRDADRRVFLKFLGTSSITLFLMAIFTKRAQAAFFGSIPGPGTVAIKNSTGQTIDPAEKQPTDGYEIAELDDSGTETYYGFVHKDGSWYITQESATGSYRYVRGNSNFSVSWAIKETLTYNTFDNVF